MDFEVTTHIQGIPVFLLVDTGSAVSIVSCAAVKQLGLETSSMVGLRLLTTTGTFSDSTTMCRSCSIDLGNRTILV
ncbi:retropepsin-like aspartic protease, partial [Mycobacterium kansasii]